MVKTYSANSKAVGKNQSDLLKPDPNRKKRFAMLPAEVYPADFEIPESLREQAKEVDESGSPTPAALEAMQEIADKENFKIDIIDGVEQKTTETYKAPDRTESGYIYPWVAADNVLFVDKKGSYAVKDEWMDEISSRAEAAGIKIQKPSLRYICVVLEYVVDDKTAAPRTIEPSKQKRLHDGSGIPFDFEFRFFVLSESAMSEWKNIWAEYPPISSDYILTAEKKGEFTVGKYANTRDCLWRTLGPAFKDNVIREARKMIKKAPEKLCRETTLDALLDDMGLKSKEIPNNEEREEAVRKFV